MTETTAPMTDILTPAAAEYAAVLVGAGFTVYADPAPRFNRRAGWFHYSRLVNGVECFGTYSDGSDGFDGPGHSMPIKPTRLNGSSAIIGARWGDAETLGLDNLSTDSVEYATVVARPENWCPMNAEPTWEATTRANGSGSVPRRFYRGATLRNATPYGIGTTYTPVTL